MIKPPRLLLSNPLLISRLLFFRASKFRGAFRCGEISLGRAWFRGKARSDSTMRMNVKFVNALQYFFQRFTHNQFFAREERDHRIRSVFDELN